MILPAVIFFIFGTIVGSFLNVVILRYNSGRSIVSGRSSCPVCRHELAWFELVPLFSFIALGGKCAKCHSKISWQYPAVELLTGLIFAAVYLHKYRSLTSIFLIPNSLFLILDLIILSLLIIILVYDLKHKIIPDGLVYTFIILSLLKLLLSIFLIPNSNFLILDLLAGPIMFLPFFLLWFFSGGRWMGLGDAKLAAGIGWFLGFVNAISAIVIGFWTGAALGIILLLIWRSKKLTMKSEIPFAPFLILGLLLVYFFGFDVTGLHLLFQY